MLCISGVLLPDALGRALLRVSILKERNGAMIIEQALPEVGMGGAPQQQENLLERANSERFGETFQVKGQRSGVTFRSRSSGGMHRTNATQSRPPTELLAEGLNILRPVIYCE